MQNSTNHTILVTGGSGFFGRRIVSALRDRGYRVHAPQRPEFDLFNFDSTLHTLNRVKPDTVIHSAAHYGGLGICMEEPANLFHRNTLMVANLLEACARSGVKRFVPIGSACAYPGNVSGDLREKEFWSGELHPTVEAYGFTKKIQIVGAKSFARQYGMQVQLPQFTNLYGEYDVFNEYRSHVAAALIRRFSDAVLAGDDKVVNWGSGDAVREFMYTGDAAEALVRLLETDYSEIINIGTGIGTSIRELANLVAEFTGFEGQIIWDSRKPDGIPRKVLDVSTMKRVLNWHPTTNLRDGLQKTILWYLSEKKEADRRQ